jgi:hypothetical protein
MPSVARNECALLWASLEDSDTGATLDDLEPNIWRREQLRSIKTGHLFQVPWSSHIWATPLWTPELRTLIQWSGFAANS